MSSLNQKTKMKIALLASDDLDSNEAVEVLRLIKSCPQCQKYYARVRGCLDILDRCGHEGEFDEAIPTEEIWNSLESRIRAASIVGRSPQFNGWVPALSMAAACIAILAIGQLDVTWQQEGSLPGPGDQVVNNASNVYWVPTNSVNSVPVSPPTYTYGTSDRPLFVERPNWDDFRSEDGRPGADFSEDSEIDSTAWTIENLQGN